MAISKDWEVVHEADIDFEDAAGRCAQLLHLRRVATTVPRSPSELIVANVHLLFPHNEASARIRVRQVHKLLTMVDQYKDCLARPPPSLLCGDFNGRHDGPVVQFLSRYGWQSTLGQQLEARRGLGGATAWVSHFTHEQQAVGVDFIFLLNPSVPRAPVPDWTDFVFSEVAQQLARQGFQRPSDAWSYVVQLAYDGEGTDARPDGAGSGDADDGANGDVDAADADADADATAASPPAASPPAGAVAVADEEAALLPPAVDMTDMPARSLDAAGFRRALERLDLERGDALSTLTDAEVGILITSCDIDGDGHVDGVEWCARFGAALRRLSGDEGIVTDVSDAGDDLRIEEATLMPACLEEGRWPAASEWGLSDHGVLTSRFTLRQP